MQPNHGAYLNASMAAQVEVKFSRMADLRIYNRTFQNVDHGRSVMLDNKWQ